MAKKKDSVGVIKPKRVVKKSTEVERLDARADIQSDALDAMQEQILGLNMAVNHQGAQIGHLQNWGNAAKEGMVSREEYDDYVKRATEWRTNINTRISGLEDDRLILKYSFFARIKWLFTGKVDAPKWR